MILDVKAKDLQPGDLLLATKRTVLGVERGARTPSGKVEVVLSRWGQNTAERKVWNARTTIRIGRGETL